MVVPSTINIILMKRLPIQSAKKYISKTSTEIKKEEDLKSVFDAAITDYFKNMISVRLFSAVCNELLTLQQIDISVSDLSLVNAIEEGSELTSAKENQYLKNYISKFIN